jgi:hypothetical protein
LCDKKQFLLIRGPKTCRYTIYIGQANAIIFHGYFVTAPENNILSEEAIVCFILVSC